MLLRVRKLNHFLLQAEQVLNIASLEILSEQLSIVIVASSIIATSRLIILYKNNENCD